MNKFVLTTQSSEQLDVNTIEENNADANENSGNLIQHQSLGNVDEQAAQESSPFDIFDPRI